MSMFMMMLLGTQSCLEVLEIVMICTRKMWHALEKEMTWLKGCGKIK
jgi:hypothetical protein